MKKLDVLPPEIADCANLAVLDLDGTRISDLTPVAGLAALELLQLNDTAVSNLAPLAHLSALQSLALMATNVSDLRPISGLGALRALWVAMTSVNDLSPLANLSALETLSLIRTQVSDLSPLVGLTALQQLSLDGTQIRDLSPLAGITTLRELSLDSTQVTDLSPLAGLTALQQLSLDGTQISDLSSLAGIGTLQQLSLDNTQVTDLSPLAGFTALRQLSFDNTQVNDLSPLAQMTRLQDAVASQNALTGWRRDGLSYVRTPIAQLAPFDQYIQLEKMPLTVETINQVRKRQGLPAHIPEGYERPKDLPISAPENYPHSEPVPPSQPLPTPGPATRFAVVGGRIDIVPADVWKNQREKAAAYHARACTLAAALVERLSKTDAVPDVAASVAALGDVLGNCIESVQPDQLRLASRSISARARTYGHPAAQWEISPDSVSAIFELADLLVDLQGFAKADIEANERAIRQLARLSPRGHWVARSALAS